MEEKKESKNEAQLRGMFEFLRGLNVKGISSFSSYDEYKKTPMKVVKNIQTAEPPPQRSLLKLEPEPEKFTDVKGEAGFAIQHSLAEREEWFDSLSDEDKRQYDEAFKD